MNVRSSHVVVMSEQSSEHISGRQDLSSISSKARPSSAFESGPMAGAVEFWMITGHLARIPALISAKIFGSLLDLPALSRAWMWMMEAPAL